ncbi:hypothetical protein NR402_12855 [Acidithiobacillus ferrooxidans]|uniref:IS66 family insertion sequence element accessory protein TnpA n=1 Tax=Acidithiobacillus ferrooxidans TaxID=920 RepID=UPI001EF2AB89|nr:hypothetical protein [Acidithiobacillus ferrooxidans]MCR2831165.1 hypothetical protein [Acidithiobacillus ferrooxidans]
MTKDEKAAYWRQQVDGFQASGLSVKNYCAQEGIAVATLHYWRKRFADAVQSQQRVTGTEVKQPLRESARGRLTRSVKPSPYSLAEILTDNWFCPAQGKVPSYSRRVCS